MEKLLTNLDDMIFEDEIEKVIFDNTIELVRELLMID